MMMMMSCSQDSRQFSLCLPQLKLEWHSVEPHTSAEAADPAELSLLNERPVEHARSVAGYDSAHVCKPSVDRVDSS